MKNKKYLFHSPFIVYHNVFIFRVVKLSFLKYFYITKKVPYF
jgi:hypothetical protein